MDIEKDLNANNCRLRSILEESGMLKVKYNIIKDYYTWDKSKDDATYTLLNLNVDGAIRDIRKWINDNKGV